MILMPSCVAVNHRLLRLSSRRWMVCHGWPHDKPSRCPTAAPITPSPAWQRTDGVMLLAPAKKTPPLRIGQQPDAQRGCLSSPLHHRRRRACIRRLIRAHQQHRHIGAAHDTFGHTAHQQVHQARKAMGSHHDQFGLFFFCFTDQ